MKEFIVGAIFILSLIGIVKSFEYLHNRFEKLAERILMAILGLVLAILVIGVTRAWGYLILLIWSKL